LTTEAEAAPLAAASPNELLPCRADRCRHVLDGGGRSRQVHLMTPSCVFLRSG